MFEKMAHVNMAFIYHKVTRMVGVAHTITTMATLSQ